MRFSWKNRKYFFFFFFVFVRIKENAKEEKEDLVIPLDIKGVYRLLSPGTNVI